MFTFNKYDPSRKEKREKREKRKKRKENVKYF